MTRRSFLAAAFGSAYARAKPLPRKSMLAQAAIFHRLYNHHMSEAIKDYYANSCAIGTGYTLKFSS